MTSAEPAESIPESESAPVKKRAHRFLPRFRPRLRFRVSIQSKILVALLLSSILSVAVIGLLAGLSGRTALREVESERLIELRESQKRQIDALFQEVTNSVDVYSSGFSVDQAVVALSAGFKELANSTITPAQQQSITNYYENQMLKPLKRITGEEVDLNAVLPNTNAQKYLQAHYTAASAPDAVPVLDAGDGSAWSAANARYNFYLRDIVTRFDYRDALLLDLDGNVVYSVDKGPDLGTNILTGPYRETNLREAYQKALRANDVEFVWITDFQPYQPQLGAPTAWVVSPIGINGKVDGVMALPVPIAKINKIMTADKHWEAAGMGAATETYLAGPDELMRSDSRLFLQDPKEYRREVIAAGTSSEIADRAIRLGGTTLVQPVGSAGLRAAHAWRDRSRRRHGLHRQQGIRGVRAVGHSELRPALGNPGHSRRLRCVCAVGQVQ